MVVLQDDNSRRLVDFYHSGSVGKIRLGGVTTGSVDITFRCRHRSQALRPVARGPVVSSIK